jgi:hypothetical protein
MHSWRLFLVAAAIALLLVSRSVVVVAQDGSTRPVHVTGVLLSQEIDDSEEEWWAEPLTVGHARGFKVIETWEWSDPRLPTDKVIVLNFDMYDIGSFQELAFNQASLLAGPDGNWTGTSSGYFDQEGVHHGVEILTGHGAYEGLFATLHYGSMDDPDRGAIDGQGLIFEGEMPPMPEPVPIE